MNATPELTPGVGFFLEGDGHWDVKEIPDWVLDAAEYSGDLTIQGYRCSVFETPEGEQWAQKESGTPAPKGDEAAREAVSSLRRMASKISGVRRAAAAVVLARIVVAGREESIGRGIREVLESQFPGQFLSENDGELGRKAFRSAWKGGIKDLPDAEDAISDFFRYLVESKHDYSRATDSVDRAMGMLLSNLRGRAITQSKAKGSRDKYLLPEEEGPEEGPEDLSLGLDDRAAIKAFVEALDEDISGLKNTLDPSELALFELIFEDGVGTFTSGIKQNIGQAAALQDKLPDEYEKRQKRWSEFVGGLRKKLLEKIQRYVDEEGTDELLGIGNVSWP